MIVFAVYSAFMSLIDTYFSGLLHCHWGDWIQSIGTRPQQNKTRCNRVHNHWDVVCIVFWRLCNSSQYSARRDPQILQENNRGYICMQSSSPVLCRIPSMNTETHKDEYVAQNVRRVLLHFVLYMQCMPSRLYHWHCGNCEKEKWLKYVDKIHRYLKCNHNKTKHNETVCILHGIYSVSTVVWWERGIYR